MSPIIDNQIYVHFHQDEKNSDKFEMEISYQILKEKVKYRNGKNPNLKIFKLLDEIALCPHLQKFLEEKIDVGSSYIMKREFFSVHFR